MTQGPLACVQCNGLKKNCHGPVSVNILQSYPILVSSSLQCTCAFDTAGKKEKNSVGLARRSLADGRRHARAKMSGSSSSCPPQILSLSGWDLQLAHRAAIRLLASHCLPGCKCHKAPAVSLLVQTAGRCMSVKCDTSSPPSVLRKSPMGM